MRVVPPLIALTLLACSGDGVTGSAPALRDDVRRGGRQVSIWNAVRISSGMRVGRALAISI